MSEWNCINESYSDNIVCIFLIASDVGNFLSCGITLFSTGISKCTKAFEKLCHTSAKYLYTTFS